MEIRPHPKNRHRSLVRFTDETEYYWFQTNNPARLTLPFSHIRFYYWDTIRHRKSWEVERSVRNRKLMQIGAYLGSEAVAGVLRDIDRSDDEANYMTPTTDAVCARIALTVHEYFKPYLEMAAARNQNTPTE